MLADNHMADVTSSTTPALTPGMQRFRILVVDDNHDSALSLAMMLSIMGHEKRTAHDGESAVATAESFLPEVVLSASTCTWSSRSNPPCSSGCWRSFARTRRRPRQST